MNRNLLGFSLLLILLGAGTGYYLISFLGILLLFSSLVPSSRPPTTARQSPAPPRQEVRRISPPPFRTPSAPVQQAPVQTMAAAAPVPVGAPVAQVSAPSYSPSLFPMPLLPPISQLGTFVLPFKQPPEIKPGNEGRDELLEVGAIIALLSLALG